jgi:ribonuclease HI
MKKLKLDHKLADLVRSGEKTSTWRLYDDKDIRVNDTLELIDKVDPGNPDTWKTAGFARVNVVVEKRLGELTDADFDGHDKFASQNEMLKTFQSYYGPQVTLQTPLKIIHFTYQAEDNTAQQSRSGTEVDVTPHLKEAKLYADGGSRGNPGPSASGFAIMDMHNQVLVKEGVYLGVTTNNQAEYQALKLGLEHAKKLGISQVHVYMDSLLVVNQMKRIFKVKNRDLWPIHEAIVQLAATFKDVTFTHVPRELNKLADGAVNEALDTAADRQ